MKLHDLIREQLQTARYVMSVYIQDLSDQELQHRPVSGAHHAAWQLGHLIMSEARMMEGVEPGSGVAFPEGFEAAHAKELSPGSEGKAFPKSVYERLMTEQRAKTLALLGELPEEALAQPAPEWVRSYAPFVGSVFVTIAGHELMHSGQVAVIRRALGKPVVI